MAKIKNNPLLKGASGMLGDVIVFREVNGETIMTNKPKARQTTSEKQLAAQDNFLQATQYGKSAVANPVSKAEYEAEMNSKYGNAYVAAVSDYLKVPEIKNIGLEAYKGTKGDKIIIKAVDDFKVVSVQVTLTGADGKVIESGEAVQQEFSVQFWEYTTKVANSAAIGNKIAVLVKDKPGNAVTEEKVI